MKKTELTRQYIALLKKSLVNELYVENELRLLHTFRSMLHNTPLAYNNFLHIKQAESNLLKMLLTTKETGDTIVLGGEKALRNVTELSHSMVGKKRLENLQFCIETVLADDIKGGFIIVDDYGSCPPSKQAIHDFREKYAISDELIVIDRQSVYWRKS